MPEQHRRHNPGLPEPENSAKHWKMWGSQATQPHSTRNRNHPRNAAFRSQPYSVALPS